MAQIMGEVGPIAKERKNTQQGYSFRGIDDVYQAVQAIMAKYGVFSLPTVLDDRTEERTTKSGSALIYRILKIRYDFYAEDGSSVPCTVIGEGMDSGDKGSNKAMSVAEKYSLLQAYKIPTQEARELDNELKDTENYSHDLKPKEGQITRQEYAQSRKDLATDIKRDQKVAQETFEIPFGEYGSDEVYTETNAQKKMLERSAKDFGITRVDHLRVVSAAMKEHGIFVADLSRGVQDWVKETGWKP